MRLPENNNDNPPPSTGEDFVKKIGLLGAVLFLILSILATILMFTIKLFPDAQPPEPEEPQEQQMYGCYL